MKTTLRYYLTPVRMAKINKSGNEQSKEQQMLVRMWRKGNPLILLVGMQADTATLENSMEVPQDVKNRTTL